jgi:hypothetical protein
MRGGMIGNMAQHSDSFEQDMSCLASSISVAYYFSDEFLHCRAYSVHRSTSRTEGAVLSPAGRFGSRLLARIATGRSASWPNHLKARSRGVSSRSFTPILFGLASHGIARRVLALKPIRGFSNLPVCIAKPFCLKDWAAKADIKRSRSRGSQPIQAASEGIVPGARRHPSRTNCHA